jgi:predicted phosphodiesterase
MKTAFISDIHSNYQALNSVLNYIHQEKAERIYCAGDIAGYCAQPNECISRLMEENVISVKGNHDEAVLSKNDPDNFSGPATEAIKWQKSVINDKSVKFLEVLRGSLVLNDISIRITHGSPDSPELYKYILSGGDVREDFESFDEQICIVGHSHKPVIFRQEIKTRQCGEISGNGVKIEEGYKYIINLGSVGQPRDGNPKACVYIYDTDRKIFIRTRHEYDISGAQQQIMATPLPVVLAERLEEGY